jgi:hypothetical protein
MLEWYSQGHHTVMRLACMRPVCHNLRDCQLTQRCAALVLVVLKSLGHVHCELQWLQAAHAYAAAGTAHHALHNFWPPACWLGIVGFGEDTTTARAVTLRF